MLWQRNLRRGILHKKVIIAERITNMRIVQYNVETKKIVQVPLVWNPDVIVSGSSRRSHSQGYGLYGGGAFVGDRTGISQSIGDVVIMKNGKICARLRNVADPQGVKQLINTLKKERAEAQKQHPMRPLSSSMGPVVPSDKGAFCINCGVQLPDGSNFCNKCGAVQH